MRTAIVTGASGFLGSSLVKMLLSNNINIIALYRTKIPEIDVLSEEQLGRGKFRALIMGIENIGQLQNLIHEEVDVFYHLAWKGIKGEELCNPITQIENSKILIECMKLAATLGCKKFIGAGSISQYENIYGGYNILRDRERYYRSCKDFCGKIGNEYSNELGIEFLWPIITNIYGPGGKNTERFIYNMINIMSNNGEIDVSEGKQLYDFVYIEDAVRAYYLLGLKGREQRKYVIGSGNVQTLRNWIEQIPVILNSSGKIRFGKRPYNGAFLGKECFDITELVEDTGYTPQVDFREGIIRTAQWMKKVKKNE